jgi:hypothetical protein
MASSGSNSKVTLRGWLGQHAIAFFFCIVFPGFVTTIVPASWVVYERLGDRVSATARTCVFYVIPWKTQRIDQVTGIDDRFVEGHITTQRENGRTTTGRTEDEAFLIIQGADEQSISVPVSPFSVESVVARSEEFLAQPATPRLRLFVIANWKFGMIMGGCLSLLTVLYVIGMASECVRMVYRLVRLIVPKGSRSN